MNQWLNDSMTHWLIDSMTQWPNDSMTQWLSDSMTQWLSDSMTQWLNDLVTNLNNTNNWPFTTCFAMNLFLCENKYFQLKEILADKNFVVFTFRKPVCLETLFKTKEKILWRKQNLFAKFNWLNDTTQADGLCVLPLNIINEKFYILLWFWLVFLSVG